DLGSLLDDWAREELLVDDVARAIKRVRKAIRFSSFNTLQSQEQEHGFGEKMPFSEFFFRKGKVGNWRETLTDEQAAQIIADHCGVMKRFGYLTEDGEQV
ncbi:MAG: hypothetical protein KKD28_00305, partial [Chloroflexi bacterium]|nr:hypothetical protein [Chloroflexota bacterium]